MASPTPTADGSLDRTPFGHVLLYALREELTGTLVVWPDEPVAPDGTKRREDRIRLDRGTPVAARLAEPSGSLDRGLLPLFERTRAPYAFYAGQDLLGADELLEGRVDPWALLAAAARTTMPDAVADAVLSRVGDLVLRLRADAKLDRFVLLPKELAFVELLRADPSSVASLVASAGIPERTVRRLAYLLLVTKCVDAVERAAVATPTSGTQRVVAAVAGATSSGETRVPAGASGETKVPSSETRVPAGATQAPPAAAASMPPGAARVSLPVPPGPPSDVPARPQAAPPATPPPPDGLAPGERALWDDITARLAALDEQTYFQMLDVGQDAGGDAARDAYFALAKKLHPDRLPSALGPLLPHAQRLFKHLTEANETLTSDETRLKYIGIVRDGGGTPAADRKMANILEATVEYQKSEVLLRRRDFAGARSHIEAAIALNPEEADYHALLARVLFDAHEGADAPLSRMLACADRAIALEAKHDRGHYARGLVLRRMGREAEAAQEFERAAEVNPKNVDAQREVRLLRMRKKGTPGAEPDKKPEPEKKKGDLGAMLGSLFKKK